MKGILYYIKPYRTQMIIGFAIKFFGTVIELLLPMMLAYMLESVIATGTLGDIILYSVLMIVFAVMAWLFNVIANRKAARVSSDISRHIRGDLFEKTLYLSARQTDKFTIPSLESRITTDTYNVHHFINMAQRMGVRAPILLIGGVSIALIMDVTLALAMIATIPFILGITLFISRKGIPLYSKVQGSIDGMVRVVREDTQGIRVIKALSKNEYENQRFEGKNETLSADERRVSVIMGIPGPVMTLLMNLGICATLILCALRVSKGSSSPTTVIAFMQYFTQITMALMAISRIFVMYTKFAASSKRIVEVVNTPDEFFVTEPECSSDEKHAHVCFENVSFSYHGKRANLKDVSFSLQKGESLGIIGATGSGKSTLIKLLMRQYETNSGKILINGRSVTSYTREELTGMFGVALQNDFLFSDTISENIKFGRDVSDEDVIRAAKIAQAHPFISELADGYSYILAPGGKNLSGGQRQRLLIARAIAARPEILILDDSSSALDYKTDANLRAALREEMSDTTVITVAQRVSSVMSSDLILVIEDGEVIGAGTHEELLSTCVEYKEISDSQMGGAIIE